MFRKPNALASYGKIANAETDPIRQIVMLYDGAIKFLNLSATAIEANDISAKAEHSNRALDIINYLRSILDFKHGGDVAPVLDDLYIKITVLIFNASAKLDAGLMREAAALLVPVRDAWEENAQKSVVQEKENMAAEIAYRNIPAVALT